MASLLKLLRINNLNIFVLHKNPQLAAQYQCDKHVVKMILETAQLLCSPYVPGVAPYRRTHYNHPCAKWTRESQSNYFWLGIHGLALADEYTYRYGKIHKSVDVIKWCLARGSFISMKYFRNSG